MPAATRAVRGAVNADVAERNAVIEAKREHDFEKIIDVYINSANPADLDSVTLTSALEACEYSQNPACLQVIPEVYNALAAKETRTRHTVILTLRVRGTKRPPTREACLSESWTI